MSVESPPQPPLQPEPPARDAKTELNAAKAYAKAQRPWYKKKRFIAFGLLAALIVISIAAGGSEKPASDAGTSPSPAVRQDQPARDSCTNRATDDCTPEVASNRAVRVDALTWSVVDTRTATTLGDQQFAGGATADDVFVIVRLRVHSNKNESATISDDAIKLESSEGNSYSADSDGTIAAMESGEDPLLFEDIGPDQTTTSTVVFDVPQGVLDAGSKLRFNELGFGSTHGYIRLAEGIEPRQ